MHPFDKTNKPPIYQDDNWTSLAKDIKQCSVISGDKTVCPMVLVEKENTLDCAVVVSSGGRDNTLKVAAICKAGFSPDAMTIVLDSLMLPLPIKDGESKFDIEKYIKEDLENKENAQECLICFRVTKEKESTIVLCPYERSKENINWQKQIVVKNDENSSINFGSIYDLIMTAMESKSVTEIRPELEALQKKLNFSDAQAAFHTARGAMAFIALEGHFVADFISKKYPEWTDAKERSLEAVNGLFTKGIIPKEALRSIKTCCNDFMGKPEFEENFKNLILANPSWIPKEYFDNIEKFVADFESFCISPYLSMTPNTLQRGDRVKVWDHKQEEYWGEGTYLKEVEVYAAVMPNGEIFTTESPEEDPENDIPEGSKIEKLMTSKIILDTDEIVYGCQIWFEKIDSDKEEETFHPYNPKK